MTLLRIQNLTKSFGGLIAVDDVSFDVNESTIKGLIGPNGAGKSTLFNCISGFDQAQSGSVLFKGKSFQTGNSRHALDAGIARTFQNTALFDDMTTRENLMVALTHSMGSHFVRVGLGLGKSRMYERECGEACNVLLDAFEMHAWADVFASELPAGTRRLVEMVRACALKPALLLLDEPAAGLNPSETQTLMSHIRRVQNLGITILLVEHDLRLVMELCDDIVVLDHGKKIAEGSPYIIQKDPAVIEAYLGGSHRGREYANLES